MSSESVEIVRRAMDVYAAPGISRPCSNPQLTKVTVLAGEAEQGTVNSSVPTQL
jgi:hypothetical protein